MNKFLILTAASLVLAGCNTDRQTSQIDQSELCVATTDEQAMGCKEGELFMARLTQPDADLRAYNALNTAALYCDTNYPIFDNPVGVICVMTHKRISALTGLQDATSLSSHNTPEGQPSNNN